MINEINNWIAEHQDEILATYKELHDNPEISWKEKMTTAYLCEKLTELDISYETFDDITGVIGHWGNKSDGPTIGIRADMDALWQNVNGDWKANHSCGHDAHMTMVLYTIRCLKELNFQPQGLLKIIFQPAEETGRGAKALIEKGVIEGIDQLLGIHVRPIQELSAHEASPGIYHGATTLLSGKIHGEQAHGARPHLGINVVDSLSAVVQAVNSIKMDPTVPYSAKVTVIKAGGQNVNVIPDYGEFGIDLRAQTNEAMEQLLEKTITAVKNAATVNGARAEVEIPAAMVAASPNLEMEEIVGQSIYEVLGDSRLKTPPVTPGGEDFHFYSHSYPNLKSTVVGLGTGLQPGLHHPNMTFDLTSMFDGIKILSLSIDKLFKQKHQ